MLETLHLQYMAAAVVYSVLGIVILLSAFWIVDKMTPKHLWSEIFDKKNNGMALVVAAFVIAVALIISSAIHS